MIWLSLRQSSKRQKAKTASTKSKKSVTSSFLIQKTASRLSTFQECSPSKKVPWTILFWRLSLTSSRTITRSQSSSTCVRQSLPMTNQTNSPFEPLPQTMSRQETQTSGQFTSESSRWILTRLKSQKNSLTTTGQKVTLTRQTNSTKKPFSAS